jgi:hypothetical protein
MVPFGAARPRPASRALGSSSWTRLSFGRAKATVISRTRIERILCEGEQRNKAPGGNKDCAIDPAPA